MDINNMQPIAKKIIASTFGSSVGCYIHYKNNLKEDLKLNKKTSILPQTLGFAAGMTTTIFVKTDKPLINLFISGVFSGVTSEIIEKLQKKYKKTASLYDILHENVKSKLSEYLSDFSITNIKGIYPFIPLEYSGLDNTVSEINNKYGEYFNEIKIKNRKNSLLPYVVALDHFTDSRPQDSIFIHAAAVLKAYRDNFRDNCLSPKLGGLTKAKEIMMAAIAVSRVNSDFENVTRPSILVKYRLKDGTVDPEKINAIDEDLKDALPEYMENYKAVLDHYGSAPFLVRTGEKPISDSNLGVCYEAENSFTHFGSVIVEKPNMNKKEYQIRFADPLSDKDIVYKIQDGKLNDVLLRLHNVYSNGNPNNNLGKSGINANIFEKGMLNEEEKITIDRTRQTGMQCGIHSSRRIIPESVYKKLGVDDCDIAKLVNI